MEVVERQHSGKYEPDLIIAVRFDEETKLMLKEKVKVESDQKAKFQAIVANNKDSFNANMIAEMQRCVQAAQNTYGVSMAEEQSIVDNLDVSEKWFTEYFQKLKNGVFAAKGGGAMDRVDFKDYE